MRNKVIIAAFMLSAVGSVFSQQFRNAVFLHHSTGEAIWGPNGSATSVPAEITGYNNRHGFSGSEVAMMTPRGWPRVPWNNEWERWHRIFEDRDTVDADIRPFMRDYGTIVIKSCFPSSYVAGIGNASDTLEPAKKTIFNYKWHWRTIIKVMGQHPNNFFGVWTNAPLTAQTTYDEQALLADQFCRWAKDTLARGRDEVFGQFPKNVYVFDIFHKLAGPNGKMRSEYAADSLDPHPNAAATALVAPQFVGEIFDAAVAYENFLAGVPNPVQLTNFGATVVGANRVRVEWATATETNNYGFEVQRSPLTQEHYVTVQDGFVPGHGTTLTPQRYSYVDANSTSGTWWYRLRQIDLDGAIHDVDGVRVDMVTSVSDKIFPRAFALHQNSPNPFNPTTKIQFSIVNRLLTIVKVYDVSGREVTTLVNDVKEPGTYTVQFDGSNLASGVYFYRLQAGDFVQSKKLLLLK